MRSGDRGEHFTDTGIRQRTAGAQVTAVVHGPHKLGAWPGFGLMCLFVAAAMVAASLMLARREA